MTDTSDEFTWRDYEDYIFEKLSDWAGPDAEVLFDQQRIGRFSQTPRQIDVLVTGRFAGITDRNITAAVDCKYYTRTIDVKQVDEFIGYVDDVATDLGLLVTNKAFTPAALQRAKVPGIELRVIVASIDDLPPPERYDVAWDDAYYESDYWAVEGGGKAVHGALIRYSCLDPEALRYSFDPDNPPERLDEVILSGNEDEVSWGNDEARARCVRAILRHRNGGAEPDAADVKAVVLDLAYHWTDGHTWVLPAGELARWRHSSSR